MATVQRLIKIKRCLKTFFRTLCPERLPAAASSGDRGPRDADGEARTGGVGRRPAWEAVGGHVLGRAVDRGLRGAGVRDPPGMLEWEAAA